jgi:hypothetical protein
MTSPVGSSSTAHTSSLTSPNESRSSKNSSTGSSGGNPFSEQDIIHPATPVGPLGHNINTTA